MKHRLIAAVLLLSSITAPLIAQEPPPEPDRRKYTHVSVHLEQAPPQDVFKALSDAGGIELVPPGNWGKGDLIRLNFDLKNQPFWFGALQAGGFFSYNFDSASFSPADRRVNIFLSRPVHSRKMCLVPPLVVMVEISKTQGTTLDLVTYMDPAVRDWVFAGPPEIAEIADPSGESLLPEDPKPQLAAPTGLVVRHPVRVKKIVRELSSLKGSFVLLIADAIDEWTISNPLIAVAQDRTIGDRTYSFVSLRRSGRQYELKLRVKGPADGGFTEGASDLTVGPGSVIATDAAGEPWRISEIKGGYQAKAMTGIGDYEYTLTLVPGRRGAGREITGIRWRIPTRMSNLELPFDFKEVSFR